MDASQSIPSAARLPDVATAQRNAPIDPRITAPARLAALRATGLLDGGSNAVLDRLTRLVTRLLGVPVALVSLVDERGQHFPGLAGLGGWAGEQRSTPLTHSFCQHVVTSESMLVVTDAAVHPLVRDNEAHTELGVVAYAGVPLRSTDGHTYGALCAIDTTPVVWTAEQLAILEDLAAAAMAEIELRATARSLIATQVSLDAAQVRLGTWEWHIPSGELLCNPPLNDMLGLQAHEFEPRIDSWERRLHPDDAAMVRQALSATRDGSADEYRCEHRLLRGDASWAWVIGVGRVTERSSTGEATRLSGVNIDNSVTKEQALLAALAQERFEAAVAGTSDGLWDWNVALDTMWFSPRCWALLGYPETEPATTRASFGERVHPDDHAQTLAALTALREHDTPCDVELRLRQLSGAYQWFRLRCAAQRDAAGTALRLAGSIQDISTQRAAEAELQRATTLLEEAQSVARLGSWSFDLASGEIVWSKQCYELFVRDEALGPPDFDTHLLYWDDDSAQRLQDAVGQTAIAGGSYALLLRTREGLNGVRFVRALGQARTDVDGFVTGMFGTVADVTAEIEKGEELVRAQHAAEAAGAQLLEMNTFLEGETVRANDMAARAALASHSKSEFLANMSHEIRTPLTAILGYTDILAEEVAVDDVSTRRVATLQTIRRAGEHLLTVINDVLDLSKIESGKLLIEHVETELPRILLDVDTLMRSRAAAKGVELHSALTTAVPDRIWSDPTRLRQILLNLVGNAAKFTVTGRIDVTAGVVRAEQGVASMLRVAVRDTGPGMTPSQTAKLFEAFHQGDASVTREHGGTGLGLTICRRLARALGGDVRLDYSEPGRGSCFVLEVPLEAHESSQLVHSLMDAVTTTAPATSAASVVSQASLRGRVLLAEDGEDNQRLITFHLERAGAGVTVVANGQLALDAIEAAQAAGEPYGLVITDMQMPVMDGYTLARTLRANRSTIPVIALTAHAMAEDRQRCLDAGCDDYATKPIDKRVLVATCIRWMGVTRVLPAADAYDSDGDFFGLEHTDDFSQDTRGDEPTDTDPDAALEQSVLISELLDDPEMLPLVQSFLVLLGERIALIERMCGFEQRADLTSLAHQLKGAAGGYGYPSITEAARTVERFASAGGTQREVDAAVAALAATCRAALRGGGAAADTQSSTAAVPIASANSQQT